MHILLLTRFYLNGQTTHVLSLAKELVRRKHRVFLVITHLSHPQYAEWLKKNNIPFYPGECWDQLSRLKNKFDVIHTHSAHTLEPALQLGRNLDIPVIATCHYPGFPSIPTLAQTQKVICVSKEIREKLPLKPEQTVVVENGVDIPPSTPNINDRKRQIIVLTRMTEAKEPGYLGLIKAAKKCNYKLIFIGNWQPPKYNHVAALGWQVEPQAQLGSAQLVVGTGRTVREGMAAGCGVLVLGRSTDGVVTPENVSQLQEYNFSGRASNAKPTENLLVQQIASLTPEKFAKLSNFGYDYAKQHFAWKVIGDRIEQVYHFSK